MDRLIRVLIERLVGRGIEVTAIPAFIRNVVNSIAVSPAITLSELNKRLHLMCWDDIELDEYTLQLIIAIFESDFDQESTHWFETTFDPKITHFNNTIDAH